MTDHDMTDEIEAEAEAVAKMVTEKQQETEADAYSLVRKIQKRRKEIERELVELDSRLGLDSASQVFFRNRRSKQ